MLCFERPSSEKIVQCTKNASRWHLRSSATLERRSKSRFSKTRLEFLNSLANAGHFQRTSPSRKAWVLLGWEKIERENSETCEGQLLRRMFCRTNVCIMHVIARFNGRRHSEFVSFGPAVLRHSIVGGRSRTSNVEKTLRLVTRNPDQRPKPQTAKLALRAPLCDTNSLCPTCFRCSLRSPSPNGLTWRLQVLSLILPTVANFHSPQSPSSSREFPSLGYPDPLGLPSMSRSVRSLELRYLPICSSHRSSSCSLSKVARPKPIANISKFLARRHATDPP